MLLGGVSARDETREGRASSPLTLELIRRRKAASVGFGERIHHQVDRVCCHELGERPEAHRAHALPFLRCAVFSYFARRFLAISMTP